MNYTTPAANGATNKSTSNSMLVDLSEQLGTNAKILSDYLVTVDTPLPSFNRNGPTKVLPPAAPEHAVIARQRVKEAARKICELASGPDEYLENMGIEYQYAMCLRWLCHFNIFAKIPLDGTVSYAEVASAVQVSAAKFKAVARMAMTQNLLCEPSVDQIAHTRTSALFITNPDYSDWATSLAGVLFDVGLELPMAMEKWPESEEKNETAYQLAFDTSLPFFAHMSQQPEKMKKFAGFMRALTSLESNDIQHLVNGFDWKSLSEATVVDVGGSTGHAAINLAKAYPSLSFIVQDLPNNVEQGKNAITSQTPDLASRITLQAHDFFKPQLIKGAAVYVLRTILHDWPAKEAVRILANLRDAMGPTSRILIMDIVLPPAGSIEPLQEATLRNRDLLMMGLFNSKQRCLEDWTELVERADEKLEILNVVRPFGSAMSVIEVGFRQQGEKTVVTNGVH